MADSGQKPTTDPKDFETDRLALILTGFVYDGSLLSKIRVPIFAFLLYSAPIHHLIPVMFDKTTTIDQILIALCLSMLYTLLCASWPFMIYNSSHVIELWATVRRGFYQYSDPLTPDERLILSNANNLIIRSTRLSLVIYFCTGFGTYLKEMSPESMRLYRAPYPGWFPWAITTNFRFAMALLYQLSICLNTTFALESVFLLFAYHTIHFEGQLRLLRKHYDDSFPKSLTYEEARSGEVRQRTLRRLKDCVQHHLVIMGFHKKILRYFGLCLLVFRAISTIMLCMLCFLTTTGISSSKILQVVCLTGALVYLLFIFCLKGEKVSQMSDMWSQALYEVDWWIHPVEVQKTVQLMLVGASKPMLIYGVWTPAMYSHSGISVIGQESFSFFNMLRAMR